MINRYSLEARVILKGKFCMEKCTQGVTVVVGEKVLTGIKPEDITKLFTEQILTPMQKGDKL